MNTMEWRMEGMSLLICLGLARPNSSTTIPGFDGEGDGSNRDYAMETLTVGGFVRRKNFENSTVS